MAEKVLICRNCGGRQDIDYGRQLYVCPFCGSTYDYDYFKEDELLSMADGFLAKGEYDSARDAYMFLLGKEPTNGYALEKVLLLSHHLTDVNDLLNKDVQNWIKGDPKDSGWVIERADESSRQRLTDIHGWISAVIRAAGLGRDKEEVQSQIASKQKKLDRIESELVEEYAFPVNGLCIGKEGQPGPDTVLKLTRRKTILTFLVISLILTAIFIPAFFNRVSAVPALILDLVIISITGIKMLITYKNRVLPAISRIRDLESRRADILKELEPLQARLAGLEGEYGIVSGVMEQCRGAVTG